MLGMPEVVPASLGATLRSQVISLGCWDNRSSEFFVPAFAAVGSRWDGSRRCIPWPGPQFRWVCSSLPLNPAAL